MQKANSTLNWAWQASLGLLLMLAVPILGAAQTFSGTGLPLPANEDVGCTTSTLEVTTDGTIGTNASIDQVELDITHTWDGDLEITLISPATTRLTLSDGNGGSGDNYTGTIFDDAAATCITAGSPPFTGTFLP
ncbi:MAG: proprotein convertase P-domain-containing protein, partial [Bacteroidota bacterium]